jgi:hypothetical protein
MGKALYVNFPAGTAASARSAVPPVYREDTPLEENRSASPLFTEPRRFPKSLWILGGILLLGLILLIPIGRSKPPRNGPFYPDYLKTYWVEPMRGHAWKVGIMSVRNDTLKTYESSRGYPLEDIARISVDGRTFYLNPEAEPNEGEMFATEQMKWAGEQGEAWNVGGFIALLCFAAMGWLH